MEESAIRPPKPQTEEEPGLSPSEPAQSHSMLLSTLEPPKVDMLTKFGVCLVMFLVGLYTMMDAVLYVPIANEFNSLSRSEWIINGYLITTTALQPLYGKGSDIVGRKFAIISASLFLLLGSVVSAVSQSMDVLIVGRAVQGIGSAGIYTMVNVVIADLFTERERGWFMGVSSFLWGIATASGIILGGVLVQLSTWRVAFWINVPIAIVIALVIWRMDHLPPTAGSVREKLRRIDFGGSALSLVSVVLVLLALSWGGRDYAWSSAAVLCSLAFGLGTAVLFVWYEHRVPAEPIVSLKLLRTRNVALALIGHLFFGAVTYAPAMFIPQWALVVKNTTPITSGLYTLPFSVPESFAVLAAGFWVTRTGRYRECVWLGSGLLLAGLTPLVVLDQHSGLGKIIGFQLIAGIGMGLCLLTLIFTAQASASGAHMASATATCLFMRSLGAILVVAVLASVNGNRLQSEFARIGAQYPDHRMDIERIAQNQSLIHVLDLPADLFDALVDAFMRGMRAAFIALIPFSAIFVLVAAAIKHVPLQQTHKL
ncbi:hypothetical protein IWW51_004126 [Coemansia sp. RSA 2702]|nr:hypothetical protein IWW52_005351 [Coemansia sp. RSA 2704]KAJ2313176.1 hypothetical protein IWW54_001675 [Coemansia sp. RSA 2705]KAJ2322668.1 hypothetical protein IWW51_004126 [Coemansia sp. RSA 2702]KAJ2737497.1 hypothetical protein H4R23_001795 [Coemansia sp. Cherry 401B]